MKELTKELIKVSLLAINKIARVLKSDSRLLIVVFKFICKEKERSKIDEKCNEIFKKNYEWKALEFKDIKQIFYFNFEINENVRFNSITFLKDIVKLSINGIWYLKPFNIE